MENQTTHEQAENQHTPTNPTNANDEQTSLATDGPVSKNEGDGTSPDLNDTTPITNADEATEPATAQEEETSAVADKLAKAPGLGLDEGDLPTDVPEEQK